MAAAPAASFSNAVNRIVLRVACTEGHEDSPVKQRSSRSSGEGPLTQQELSDLSLLCLNTADSFASVELELLVALLQLLTQHIDHAVQVDVIGEALGVIQATESPSQAAAALEKWLRSTGSSRLMVVSQALEAAAVLVHIASTPAIDPRVVNEDDIQAAITFMRVYLQKALIPALNQTGHLQPQNGIVAAGTPKRRKRTNASSTGTSHSANAIVATKDLKKVYKSLLASTSHLQLLLMERLEVLVRTVALDGAQILSLTNGALPALQIACNATTSPAGQHLQFATLALVKVAFGRYPAHRESILEDLFPLLLQLPTGKRFLRNFPVRYASACAPQTLAAWNQQILGDLILSNGSASSNNNINNSHTYKPTMIQMMTALVLQLVQSVVTKPHYIIQGEHQQQDQQQQQMRWSSGLQACQSVADYFCDQLLKRCTTAAGAEFRAVLTHTVEDLLTVFLIPEYPAAEILLGSLVQRLLRGVSPDKGSKSKNSVVQSYTTVGFDALGKICAVQARILAMQRPLSMCTEVRELDDDDNDTAQSPHQPRIQCYCQQDETSSNTGLLVGCVGCKTFYHGRCVGVSTKGEEWYCDACRLGRIFLRERAKFENVNGEILLDKTYTLRHAFQTALAHRLGVDGIQDAQQVHLARWIGELESRASASAGSKSSSKSHQQHPMVTELLLYWDKAGPSGEILTEEGSCRLIMNLACETSPLMRSFRSQIRYLLKLAEDDSSHALRKLSLKAIEKTVEGDPNQMLLPIITKSVSRRLTDEAISVREAALSLVGLYVTRSPAFASAFHSSLLPRLTDTGVSVRKRAVKIFEAILTSNPSYKGRSSVFDALLQRAADPKEEDGVRDLIDALFSHLWLETNATGTLVPFVAAETTGESPVASQGPNPQGVVTPTPPASPKQKARARLSHADMVAEQMIEVVRSAGSTVNLEALLKKFLGGSSDEDKGNKQSERKKRKELDKKQCEKIVKSLFEFLVSAEEQKDELDEQFGQDLAAALRTIAVFADISPEFVFSQIDSLLPYLKADNGVSIDEESSIVAAVCEIIYRLGESFNEPLAALLSSTSVAKDLKNITCRFGPFALNSAIRAFSCLSRQKSGIFSSKLLDLGKMFYSFLFKRTAVDNFDAADAKTRNSAHRALTVLGFICQYRVDVVDATIWDEEEAEAELFKPQQLNWSNMMLACFRIFMSFLLKEDSSTKCKALRALGGIFVSQPRLLLQLDQEGLVEELMAEDAGVALQLESLQCWCKILQAEEKRVDGGHAKDKMDSDHGITLSKRISGDQDGDSTLFGGVLTNHATRLFTMTTSKSPILRQSVLEVLGLLLRQGLVNPNDATPYLFACVGDTENDSIRSLALQLLSTEGQKRPDTLRRRICAGVKRAYEFQSAVYSHAGQISPVVSYKVGKETEYQCIFSHVFRECIGKNRKERRGFFKNLLALFRLNAGSLSRRAPQKDLALLQFVAQMLAHLDYGSVDDPLFIIHEITSLVSLAGPDVLDNLSDVLRPVGLASSDKCDDDVAAVDALERAASSQFPSRTNEAVLLSSEHFGMDKFSAHCRDATCLSLTLELKTFLRQAYNLSETRCLEYDPSATERICDKAPKMNTQTLFAAVVPRSLIERSARVDKDALIRQYAQFRQLMREETSAEEDLEEDEDDSTMGNDKPVDEMTKKRSVDEI